MRVDDHLLRITILHAVGCELQIHRIVYDALVRHAQRLAVQLRGGRDHRVVGLFRGRRHRRYGDRYRYVLIRERRDGHGRIGSSAVPGQLVDPTQIEGIGVVALVVLPSVATFSLMAVVMVLYGAAYGMLFPSISALVADSTGPEERGTAAGIFHAFLTAGVGIGAPVIGWVGGVVGVESGLMLSAGVIVVALIIALTALRRV